MQDLKEPTQANIDAVAVTPGTHYFVVEPWRLSLIRASVYSALSNGGKFKCHTSYDKVKRVLRVVVSD